MAYGKPWYQENRDKEEAARYKEQYGDQAQGYKDLDLKNKQLDQQMKAFELQRTQAAAQAAKGLNPDGSPIAPEFKSMLDAAGNMQSKYNLAQWQNVMPDTAALDQYKQTALRGAGELSPWAKLQQQKMDVEQAQALDNAGAASNTSMMSAMSKLAQTGGLSGGARERAMSQAANAGMVNRQQVGRQNMLDTLNLASQDETQRMSGLQTLQGMQNTQADAQFRNAQQGQETNKFNTSNLLLETDRQRQFTQDQWKQKMETWAANKSADAQARASGGGGKK